MRSHTELIHSITVLYNWASNPDRDTVSALTDRQAKEASTKLRELWAVLDRRSKKS